MIKIDYYKDNYNSLFINLFVVENNVNFKIIQTPNKSKPFPPTSPPFPNISLTSH